MERIEKGRLKIFRDFQTAYYWLIEQLFIEP